MWQNEGGMISAAGVRYAVGKLTASRFHRCMGRVPSEEKNPGHTSAEGKCTVHEHTGSIVHQETAVDNGTNLVLSTTCTTTLTYAS